jgi:restriction system protein
VPEGRKARHGLGRFTRYGVLMSTDAGDLPRFEMLWPVLEVVSDFGGSATIQEIDEAVPQRMGLTEEELSVLHGSGPRTEIAYRLAWCRTYLKYVGALVNSARGVWAITEEGRLLTEEDMAEIPARVRAMRRRRGGDLDLGSETDADETEVEEDSPQWREVLLATLVEMEPSAFERLCQRLLREAGFVSVQVTGRSGDGGIDGVGVLQVSLLSFPVFFQAKRYSGSVGSGAVRDFRGAMAGRGEKGLLITTGTFSREAKLEARRDGATPVDLIDGERLCELLCGYTMGVERVEDVRVQPHFFADI